MRRSWYGMPLFVVSVLLHLAMLWLFLSMRPPLREQGDASKAIAMVWIKETVKPPDHGLTGPQQAGRRPTTPKRARVPKPARTASAVPVAAPEVQTEAAPDAPQPVFDRSAALASARKLASEPDAARLATVGGQIDARRTLTETQDEKLGRKIAEGKRGQCLTANGGGSLLTPLMWLLDKKDHGCKLF